MVQIDVNREALGFGLSTASVSARLRAWLGGSGEHALTKWVVGTAYTIRVASAVVVYLSQIALARWMGNSEFGIYVYVWTWVLLIGDVIHLGLPLAAQRLIPAYNAANANGSLRGFVFGAWRFALVFAVAGSIVGAFLIRFMTPWLDPRQIIPFYLACISLPFVTLSIVLDGIARNYNWIGLALAPHFLWRPLLVLALIAVAYATGYSADAVTAMAIVAIAAAVLAAIQLAMISRRLAAVIAPGARRYEIKSWLAVSLPMILVWGFYTLLTYTDVIMLQQFRSSEDVAHYYGAARTLLLVSFVYFSVAAAVAHRFTSLHLAGNRAVLAAFVARTVHWTFWPSLLATILILALGWPLLRLFGPDYVTAYPTMFVLAIGPLARASVGPAERLLNMLGEQRACGFIYAGAFAVNLLGCFVLIPRIGVVGAAIATSTAVIFESIALYVISKHRLGLHVFVFGGNRSILLDRGYGHGS